MIIKKLSYIEMNTIQISARRKILLSLHNVEGVLLWEVAAGGADQKFSIAKLANCYVI
jgi:hypothetical protein